MSIKNYKIGGYNSPKTDYITILNKTFNVLEKFFKDKLEDLIDIFSIFNYLLN